MSYGNWKPAFCEQLHSYIIEEFHIYRKENNLPIDFVINGSILSNILVRAKKKLYSERPEAKKAGFEDLDKLKEGNEKSIYGSRIIFES